MPIINFSKTNNNTIITKHKMRERELPIQKLPDERKTKNQNIVSSKIILLGEMERVSVYFSTNQAKSEAPKSMNGDNR